MSLPLQQHIQSDGFRLRGTEMSRIDGFSDVVFGFALTLLVVSLEIPKTYAELHESLLGFFPFAICFMFLMMVWHAHYKFFRRFGLHDKGTIFINSMLLFVILFFVYPLKFLFTFVVDIFSGRTMHAFESSAQIANLMAIYAIGYACVYLLFGALYWNAWRQREVLELNPLERALLNGYLYELLGIASVGLLAAVVAKAVPYHLAGFTGLIYLLIAPANIISRHFTRKRIAKLPKTHKPYSAH
jgi:uncharacterized membrane protein